MFLLSERLSQARAVHATETTALFAALALILALVGWLLGDVAGAVVALGGAVVVARSLATLGTTRIMRLQGALPLQPRSAPGLHGLVRGLAARAGLASVPRLYLLPGRAPNAYAMGSGGDAAIALSRGLIEQLDERELAAVLAHELSHIRAGDTDAMRFASALVQMTRTVGQVGLILCVITAFTGAASPLLLALGFFAAPSLALALQLWLSRRREFAADAGAVDLTGDAYGLAAALARLDRRRSRLRHLGDALGTTPSWLATHPATSDRLERLAELQPEAFQRRPPQPLSVRPLLHRCLLFQR